MARISPLMILPPAIFAGLAGLFAFGMMRDDPDELPSALIGRAAPATETGTLQGRDAFDASVLADGEVKLVNFWASWCAPCRVEHPNLALLAEEGLPVYGVNYKDDPAKAVAFLDELGDFYTAIGTDDGPVARDWGVYGVPETFVVDGEGTIIARMAGPVTQRAIENRLRPALEEAAAR
ncbi:DsbE family thiol:disulfide interchange protein [Limimaricola pyoseonensis]|uniref:Cytochrome c biogenesis protein CcmG, thiol:disulfide interchange protein DsbE n=1 Tax=Limimaricola pyoseonensis TaxID=521013 RepID=A0A1G6ZSD2_9RHOB|nr:DsbE family thiol:disulfide interchange protein [Limimaricola pyoseonensis]SDE05598.1 cytochrome c biogenesis protein CcmG, thiol:disulfide interchange protein DsbE [Limimaricola pyoseonensis]